MGVTILQLFNLRNGLSVPDVQKKNDKSINAGVLTPAGPYEGQKVPKMHTYLLVSHGSMASQA